MAYVENNLVLLTVQEAAEYLGVSRARVHQLLANTTSVGGRLVGVCPLSSQPKDGKRSYRTTWVTLQSVKEFANSDRRSGPKQINFDARVYQQLAGLSQRG